MGLVYLDAGGLEHMQTRDLEGTMMNCGMPQELQCMNVVQYAVCGTHFQ